MKLITLSNRFEFNTLKTEIDDSGMLVCIGLGVDNEIIYRQIRAIIYRFILEERVEEITECSSLWAYYFHLWLEFKYNDEVPPTYGDERDYQVSPIFYYENIKDKELLYPYLLKVYRDTISGLFWKDCEASDTISNCIKIDGEEIEMPPLRKNEYEFAFSFLNKTLDEFEKMWREGRGPRIINTEPQPQPEPTTSTSTLTSEREEAVNQINNNHSLKQAFEMAKEGGLLDDNYQPTDKIETDTLQAYLAQAIKDRTGISWQLFNRLWGIKDKNKISRLRSRAKQYIGKVRGEEIVDEVFSQHTLKR